MIPDFYSPVGVHDGEVEWYVHSLSLPPRRGWVVASFIPPRYETYARLTYPGGQESFAPNADDTLDILAGHPRDECVCFLWGGWDTPHLCTVHLRLAKDSHYDYLVYRADYADLAMFLRREVSPNYVPVVMWPADRRWCAHLSFSSPAAYVGASANTIRRLLSAVPGAVVAPDEPT